MIHTGLHNPVIKNILLIASVCISLFVSQWAAADTAETAIIGKKVDELSKAMIDGDGKALKLLSAP